ncbi:MAG: glycogen/starch/alpha-glucan phosphorylase [Phycisphaerae bacterium]|jgi:starch phosphorylase
MSTSGRKPPKTPPLTRPTAKAILKAFDQHLEYSQAKHWDGATPHDFYMSLARAVRDSIMEALITTQSTYRERDVRRVYYLSMEYMLGRQLRNNLVCLGVYDDVAAALAERGLDLDGLCELEPDAGLGNGGLGRLAACYLDSAATLELPMYGYGLRYEYGIFDQDIVDGWQVERPDYWLRLGTPWQIVRPDFACAVRMYGHVEDRYDAKGGYRPTWVNYRTVLALPYDMPIVACGPKTVNLLRLWAARASESFDLAAFNRGGYVEAVREQALTETITKVLYPNDETDMGRELRLVQEYFFVAATISDIIRRYEVSHDDITKLPEKAVLQLNDTHPALAIAELMRIFVDERRLPWEAAWELTRALCNYTNHTLLPEALEVWPVSLIGRVLPRHLQIIFELNRRFLEDVQRLRPNEPDRIQRVSLIQETPFKAVRMANLAVIGSTKVNGVSALHTDLLRRRLFADFAELWPDKFVNCTNGITPRRWLLVCNPRLAQAITRRIGEGWQRDLSQLQRLAALADDAELLAELRAVKAANKQALAAWIQRRLGVAVAPASLFDVHVKRLHEYKRQLLNILRVVIRYHDLLDNPRQDCVPRTVLFGAKAAPAYGRAKLIIKLINDVAAVINADKRVSDRLRVVFLPNYNTSLAEKIIPAADLSEQISTAGMEASGTGNMKFALNGALTIGTLDGANIEIREAVGADNFFVFGLTAEEVAARRSSHNPWDVYNSNAAVRRALDDIGRGAFSPQDPRRFLPIFDWLMLERDRFMVLADIEDYLAAQARVDAAWADSRGWSRGSLLNIANMGRFSSDRAVREYADGIWDAGPVVVGSRPERSAAPKPAREPAPARRPRTSAGGRARTP